MCDNTNGLFSTGLLRPTDRSSGTTLLIFSYCFEKARKINFIKQKTLEQTLVPPLFKIIQFKRFPVFLCTYCKKLGMSTLHLSLPFSHLAYITSAHNVERLRIHPR